MPRGRKPRPVRERFGEKFIKGDGPNACWIWTDCMSTGDSRGTGYGRFWLRGKTLRAHRVAWELYRGPIPDGLHVLHRCDNPSCVRPDHLWLGTTGDNNVDRDAKGRGNCGRGDQHGLHVHPERIARGEQHGHARLTIQQIQAIRRDARFQREIAAAYGVAQSTISVIRSGKTWSHLPDGQAVIP